MTPGAAAANLLWAGASLRRWRSFRGAVCNPGAVQRELLAGYLRENARTVVGRAYSFSGILAATDVVAAFQQAVPITTYDDIAPLVSRLAAGEPCVLTAGAVQRLTPSSGSTSAAKLLPHTRQLQAEFSAAVDAWIADLYMQSPSLIGGRAYWSITPSISFEQAAAARLGEAADRTVVPIGFEDDSAYLGGLRRRLVRAIMAVPDGIRLISDPESFRYASALFLARARNLRLISVWHPSFLSQLLETLLLDFDRIIDDIEHGTVSVRSGVPAVVESALRPDPRRAGELRGLRSVEPREVWPELALVSCWGDGPARPYAQRLAGSMPHVAIQPKGLIATEAIVSIPFAGKHPVAVTSHFLEFIDPDGRPRLAHELEMEVEYIVVVTTGGGLYRYRLGDRVKVDGWLKATPSIEFMGRGDRVSDRFGEKLSDGFVTAVLTELFERGPAPRFAMLAPESTASGISYTLLVDTEGDLPPDVGASLEQQLRQNPHYAWCVDLGQLRPSRVVRVGPGADRAYMDACVARGHRLGDVKPVALHNEGGWEQVLCLREPPRIAGVD
jgi:hypothetical protein